LSARHKLNTGYIYGSLALAALAGGLTGSWFVFFLATAVLILGGLHDGTIRPKTRL
jgi:hypothetical protein